MAEWSKNKVDATEINGGKEFTTDDVLAVNELNAMVNNSFYGVNFVEAMADSPDISEIAGTGTPSVSLVDNGAFKKFKFANLKGADGVNGSGIYYSVGMVNNGIISHDTITNASTLLTNGDLIITADGYLYQVIRVNLVLGGVTTYQVSLMADQFKGEQGIQGEKGEQGIQGKVGAIFSYDADTKTLNIITE